MILLLRKVHNMISFIDIILWIFAVAPHAGAWIEIHLQWLFLPIILDKNNMTILQFLLKSKCCGRGYPPDKLRKKIIVYVVEEDRMIYISAICLSCMSKNKVSRSDNSNRIFNSNYLIFIILWYNKFATNKKMVQI